MSGVRLTFVDLQWIGNHKLADALGDLAGNDLAAVPRGPQKLGGTWYKIGERLIRVRGQESPVATHEVPGLLRLESLKSNELEKLHVRALAGMSKQAVTPMPRMSNTSKVMMTMMGGLGQASAEPPDAVHGIVIGARFDTLHILHSTMFGNAFGAEDGTEIGTYIVHYADRTEERIPIIYGKDVRDWWRSSDPAQTSGAKLAWAGKNACMGEDDAIRLFSSEWKNPRPDVKVMSIDFETRNTACPHFWWPSRWNAHSNAMLYNALGEQKPSRSSMQYRQLGNSGLIISRLSFGAMTFGSGNVPAIYKVDQENARAMLHRALDAGINFFDTADGYAAGQSEQMLGAVLSSGRSEVVISTKVGFRNRARADSSGPVAPTPDCRLRGQLAPDWARTISMCTAFTRPTHLHRSKKH